MCVSTNNSTVPSSLEQKQQQPYFSSAIFNICMPLSAIYTCLAHVWVFMRYQCKIQNSLPQPLSLEDGDQKKVVIITGSNTGLGYETATKLVVDYGYDVILACRSRDKAIRAMETINKQASSRSGSASGSAIVLGQPLDLSNFTSVKKYAEAVKEQYPQRINVLINNAGLNSTGKSDNNLDLMFQTNYLGHFLLTNLLLDQLKDGGRIVNLSSVMHHFAGQQPKDNAEYWNNMAKYHPSSNPPPELYASSKLAMILFSQELNRRYGGESHNITSIAVNPGSVASDIWRGFPIWLQTIFRYVYLSPRQGCTPAVAAATIDTTSGKIPSLNEIDNLYYFQPYWIPNQNHRPMIPFTEMLGPYVGYTRTTPRLPVNRGGTDEAKALWQVSEALTTMKR